jgi:hypothetical protein
MKSAMDDSVIATRYDNNMHKEFGGDWKAREIM